MGVINFITKATKNAVEPIKELFSNKNYRSRLIYTYYLKYAKVKEKTIMYEAYHGRSASCSPYALFLKMINSEEYKDFQHIWVLKDFTSNKEFLNKYSTHPNVKIVKIYSYAYLKALATAQYLINNTTFPSYFQKREGQVYINTWHGVPIKAMGRDIKNTHFSHYKNIQRNFLHADYLVMPNDYTARKLIESHDVKGIFAGKVLDVGSPRVDLIFAKSDLKHRLGINGDTKIILYAPTWRGKSENKEDDLEEKFINDVHYLLNNTPNGYRLLVKAHMFMLEKFKKAGLDHLCVPNEIDTNEILAETDVLITDYSSIIFDYLPLKKPILFYVYDLNDYEKNRGFYLSLYDFPGPKCQTIDELICELKNIESYMEKYGHIYDSLINHYCYNDDGHATERVLKIIFKGMDHERVYKVSDQRKKVIIYPGGISKNGITTSVINLLNTLDHNLYNISIIVSDRLNDDAIEKLKRINRNVNIMFRFSTFNFTILEHYRHLAVMKLGLKNKWMFRVLPKDLYKRELNRLMGLTTFDVAVHFCGYSPIWALLIAFNEFGNKVIYMHNDMYEEAKKKIKGVYKHKRAFNVVFPLYKYFNKIVSVSKQVMEVNKNKLAEYCPKDKMTYANNTINIERIFQDKDKCQLITYNDEEYYIKKSVLKGNQLLFEGFKMPRKDRFSFITIGRLSPEKDHQKLIHAFSKVKEKYTNVQLYILGEGPLEKELIKLIGHLGLEKDVVLTGHVDNPFYLLARSDCFVLSSNYEGQPMVLLEALSLGLPVIATDIPGSRSLLQNGHGYLVENSTKGLEKGMIKALNGELKNSMFDYHKYNQEALQMFYNVING